MTETMQTVDFYLYIPEVVQSKDSEPELLS